ncbi:NitT/TauT family transport system substrate-binding protein [Murinocardiopsis flavida]|uniref:NitT/TauT family transport system substrate-binding protein n=1 Tax=Murinocardiopsis flavida TaxID=645275 RepID=A0A2P8DTT1_9ACTN|nr:ABC transporter substrate-binding protein [Murinocardiopsis flavida]PSL00630.1 NitT/TauT family transport system substrate-binding protein [Murinocardiopsis flavida]
MIGTDATAHRTTGPAARRGLAALASAVVLCTALAACNPGLSGRELDTISIGYQPGIGYAPLLLMRQERVLEERFPDKEFEWRELNSGAAIRDGAISGEIQIAAGGIGPFIVGYGNGVPWKVLVGLDDANLRLMSMDAESLADLKGSAKIAMPGPDSIQAIVLRKAARDELGSAGAFDSQMVAMGHPDGMQALISGQMGGHLTAPPFQERLTKEGANTVVQSYDVFGEHTFNSVYVLEPFYGANTEVVHAFRDEVADSVERLRDDPKGTAPELAAVMGGGVTAAEVEEQITSDDISYTTRPRGFMEYARFMQEIGLVEEIPDDAGEFCYPGPHTKDCT